ncbi:MAG TPA: 2OG-Fe(II) oxygenase [Allosphingosinicella sp.]|jgi:prolyl 4-hydroxylase
MAEADALFERAAAALTGAGGRRDTAAARELFRQAAAAGSRNAAVIFTNLVASGVGGPRDWPAALRFLESLAPSGRRSQRELETVRAMALTPAGDPAEVPRGERVCEAPEIVHFAGFFTAAECRYLIEAAEPMLEPSVVVDNATGRQVRDPVRTSDGAGFTWPLETLAVHALNRRIAAASGTTPEQGEPLQVLRYRPGDQYRTHFDAIPGFENQRVYTLLVWLNDAFEGGETEFPEAGLSLRFPAGDAILFRNVGADGRRDPAAAHAGLPVTKGEKLIASRWIRARPFEPPVGGRAA